MISTRTEAVHCYLNDLVANSPSQYEKGDWVGIVRLMSKDGDNDEDL